MQARHEHRYRIKLQRNFIPRDPVGLWPTRLSNRRRAPVTDKAWAKPKPKDRLFLILCSTQKIKNSKH